MTYWRERKNANYLITFFRSFKSNYLFIMSVRLSVLPPKSSLITPWTATGFTALPNGNTVKIRSEKKLIVIIFHYFSLLQRNEILWKRNVLSTRTNENFKSRHGYLVENCGETYPPSLRKMANFTVRKATTSTISLEVIWTLCCSIRPQKSIEHTFFRSERFYRINSSQKNTKQKRERERDRVIYRN